MSTMSRTNMQRLLNSTSVASLRADARELVAKLNSGHAGWHDVEVFKARGERAREIWAEQVQNVQWDKM